MVPSSRTERCVAGSAAIATITIALVLFGASDAHAQDVPEVGPVLGGIQSVFGSDASISHPASVARRHWQELGLSDEQFRAMEGIEREFGAVVFRYVMAGRAGAVGPEFWWGETTVTEDGAREQVLAKVDSEVAFLLGLAESRDRAYELLAPEQASKLRTLVREGYERQLSQVPAAQSWDRDVSATARTCVSGSSGGGLKLSEHVEVVFSVSKEGDSARIDNIFVARGDRSIPSMARSVERPEGPGTFVSGGTVGRWWLLFDRAANTAWIDETPIIMGENNVVLLTGVDRLNEPPDVSGLLRVPSQFHTGGCTDGSRFQDHLRRHLMEIEDVRSFVEGG